MGNTKTIADINDEALYQLSDIEAKFSIPIVALIEAASRYTEPIKLCIKLDSKYNAALIEKDGLVRSTFQITEVFKGNKSIRTIDYVPTYRLIDAFALVIRWPIIKKLLATNSVSSSVFQEVYVSDKNHKSSIQSVSTESYAKVLGLASNINWQFAAFHVDIPPNVFLPPECINISKHNLMIIGFELNRYLSELASVEPKKIEAKKIDLPKNKTTRDDPFRLEMKLAIEFLLKEGKKATPSTVMAYLKSKAGHDGCAITRVDDKEGVWWLNSSGVEEYIDNKNLKNRLTYLRKSNPELFDTQPK